jgi:hypothetical protein
MFYADRFGELAVRKIEAVYSVYSLYSLSIYLNFLRLARSRSLHWQCTVLYSQAATAGYRASTLTPSGLSD